MTTFTIIGGGATGTLLAVNLIKNSNNQPITIIGVTQLSESHCNYDAKVVFQLSRKACVYKA